VITRLRHRVGEAIRDDALWAPGMRVAVAVSGGLDSVALLDLLVETGRWHRGALSVAHVDHGARPDSGEDAAFVERLAAERGLPCVVRRLQLGPASEALLRDGRYAAFADLDVDRVALAHHREDLAETVILQLLRGAGTAGLAGMRPVRDRYVRPLLGVGRDELRAWAQHRGLAWREDPTNADLRYTRNRIRAEVLPLLERVRPGAVRAIARSAAIVAKDDEWIASLVVPGPPWDVAFVCSAPEPIVRRSILAGVPDASAGAIDEVMDAARRGRGRVYVGRGVLVVDHTRVVLAAAEGDLTPPEPDVTCSTT
jgi:tRNA(Ile)-lysidine synthetase-like protein